ncbi:MAG: hypothetical protein ABIE25_00070 [Thermoplasmatota archaeon]
MTIQRIPLGSPEDLESTVRYQLKRNVGPGFYISGTRKISPTRAVFEVGNSYIELIEDSRVDSERMLVEKRVDGAFTVDVVEQNNKYAILLPEYEVMIEALSKRMSSEAMKSETVLIGTAHTRFVRIPVVAMALLPISQILEAVDQEGRVSPSELYHRKGPGKLQKYLDFLTQTDFVKRDDGHYVAGNQFRKFKLEEDESRYESILASVLETGYEYLQSYFHLTMLTPYIRISNSYYYPSQEYGDRLRMRPELLRKYEKRFYKVSHPLNKLRSHAGRMKAVRIFGAEGEYIVGDKDLYESYCNGMESIVR